MATRQTILGAVVCILVAAFAAQSRMRVPLKIPRWERGTTKEEYREQVNNAIKQQRLQRQKLTQEHVERMAREAWKNELRIGQEQWRIIGPKCQRQELVSWEAWAQAIHGIRSHRHFEWRKVTEDKRGGLGPKAAAELTEAEILVSELIDLVRQEDPNDQQLREKIDALQKVREKARKELPKAKRELAAVLTTPRQEAVFLLMGRID